MNNWLNFYVFRQPVSIMSGKDFWQTVDIKRLNIPSIFLADGPHGIRKQAAAADHLGLNESIKATCFPSAATMANSWNIELGLRLGKALSKEALTQKVETVQNIEEAGYTAESYATFKAAYDAAVAVLAKTDATQEEVDTALTTLAAAIEGLTEKPAEKPLPFEDVSEKQWYHTWIKEAYNLGLMTGATETLFKPNSNMNRGMVAIVFHRMEGSKKVEYSKVFPDVANNQYYTTSVLWAKANGVINGYTDGTFKPLKNVTREEMVTMIYNFAKYKGLDVKSEHNIKYFNDYAKITQYAKAPLRWAVENELISGKDNGTRLDPLGTATRAECCKMLVQAYKVIYK